MNKRKEREGNEARNPAILAQKKEKKRKEKEKEKNNHERNRKISPGKKKAQMQ
jgi:hypothetical protein